MCSADGRSATSCTGVKTVCTPQQACDPATFTCIDACTASANAKSSAGCDFYATQMDVQYVGLCFAAYVVNGSATAAHLAVEFEGSPLTVEHFTWVPPNSGPVLPLSAFDADAGIPPGGAAVLFLGGASASMTPCPAAAAIPSAAGTTGTAIAHSFHIATDTPVSAFQINPYGGGLASTPGASLLLPTPTWGTNYALANAGPTNMAGDPSLNIVASVDNTHVTLLPTQAIVGGGTIPAGPAGMPLTFTLNKGENAQLSQPNELTGSVVQADQPVGVFAGHACLQEPVGTNFCDHAEQMLPPISALGSEYVAAPFRPRVAGDQVFWRLQGVVAGTLLTYSSSIAGAPPSLNAGEVVEISTNQAFTIKSQDSAHPFLLFAKMSGSQWSGLTATGYGDPDFVLTMPVRQFGTAFAFMADATFPENTVVVVRAPNLQGMFSDVTLDCAGALTGWQSVGTYQWTTADLVRHDFVRQGTCQAGPRKLSSDGPFGAWMWGWGSPETTMTTTNVSYGYPVGMNAQAINSVVVPAMP
jgi:hypothetical protein